MKAIETLFNGYRFRSRLEARWAVWFNSVGIPYEYEKQGYDLDGCGQYLPDFYLPTVKLWVEIKGRPATHKEREKAAALARHTEIPVLILSGNIGVDYDSEMGWWEQSYRGEIHYGSPALYARHNLPTSTCKDDIEYSMVRAYSFAHDACDIWRLADFVLDHGETLSIESGSAENLCEQIIAADMRYYKREHGRDHPRYRYGIHIDSVWIENVEDAWEGQHTLVLTEDVAPSRLDNRIVNAFTTARSARFEHGEQPDF